LALLFAPATGKANSDEFAKNIKEGLQAGRENVEPVVKRIEKEFGDLQKNIEDHLK
jgi:gas vesicle protein